MHVISVTQKEREIAAKIITMLREECRDDLILAVKSLAFANQVFQTAFRRTVEEFPRLKGGDK